VSASERGKAEGAVDLTTCDREPIHIPGSVQPHGVLFAIEEATLKVLQVSENVADFFGRPSTEVLGSPLSEAVGEELADSVQAAMPRLSDREPLFIQNFSRGDRSFTAVAHRSNRQILFEVEIDPEQTQEGGPTDLHSVVTSFIAQVQGLRDIGELGRAVAQAVRSVILFDRILVYRFDEDGTGIVVAEDRNDRFPSLQDHRFPASDIPRQARELYRLNRLRIIADAEARQSPIVPTANPLTNAPLDLSFSILRSVSPIHVEYMKNMGTPASMSVSILVDGRLWGLISCHHSGARLVPFNARTTCDLLAQVFALQIGSQTHSADAERRVELKSGISKLLATLAESDDLAQGLASDPDVLLSFVRAGGAAIVTESGCTLVGATPSESEVREIAAWLFNESGEELFHSDRLSGSFERAMDYADRASGLLAISVSKISPATIMWFRPEVIETIQWGGDPRKSRAEIDQGGRINPRTSFETWRETVRHQAVPWQQSEIDAAAELRGAILGIVLRRVEELAAISSELQRTNADLEKTNEELEAFSYSVSHDLRAPLRHIVGYAEILKEVAQGHLEERHLRYADTIIESTEYAGKLVDNLLAFSRMGRTPLATTTVDMALLVREAQREAMLEAQGREVVWTIGPLPTVDGDTMMLRLVVQNLFSNALKYTRTRERTEIEVGSRTEDGMLVFFVKDNGVGFDMRYKDKLFGVFQRLHRWEDYEGTGIGLANVRRIVERHGGKAWAEGEENLGATFYFSLPVSKI
jgi:light-regulated signal transduction histidine kinase (bacteriophytochrome)